MNKSEAIENINNLVRINTVDASQHRYPAKLLGVKGQKAIVQPFGHRRPDSVPLDRVQLWKSRNPITGRTDRAIVVDDLAGEIVVTASDPRQLASLRIADAAEVALSDTVTLARFEPPPPAKCAGCDTESAKLDADGLCPACVEILNAPPSPTCSRCGDNGPLDRYGQCGDCARLDAEGQAEAAEQSLESPPEPPPEPSEPAIDSQDVSEPESLATAAAASRIERWVILDRASWMFYSRSGQLSPIEDAAVYWRASDAHRAATRLATRLTAVDFTVHTFDQAMELITRPQPAPRTVEGARSELDDIIRQVAAAEAEVTRAVERRDALKAQARQKAADFRRIVEEMTRICEA